MFKTEHTCQNYSVNLCISLINQTDTGISILIGRNSSKCFWKNRSVTESWVGQNYKK